MEYTPLAFISTVFPSLNNQCHTITACSVLPGIGSFKCIWNTMNANPQLMHTDYMRIILFRVYRLIFEGEEGEGTLEKHTWKEQKRGFFYSQSAETRTIIFHCCHMTHKIIKLNMKPMSHGEAQIIREVSSVLTAAPLKRLCQLSALCLENKSWNITAWRCMAHGCSLINISICVWYYTWYSQS